jgi:hypothetical protein
MSQPRPPLPPLSALLLPRLWRQMSRAQQQQLAQHWARLLQQMPRLSEKERPHADDLVR